MSFKQVRNYPRDLAKPYVVVPSADCYDKTLVERNAFGSQFATYSDTSIRCGYTKGEYLGGYPTYTVTFKVSNKGCAKLSYEVLYKSGNNSLHTLLINGVEVSTDIGNHEVEIDKRQKYVEIEIGGTNATESGDTDQVCIMEIGSISLLKK